MNTSPILQTTVTDTETAISTPYPQLCAQRVSAQRGKRPTTWGTFYHQHERLYILRWADGHEARLVTKLKAPYIPEEEVTKAFARAHSAAYIDSEVWE